MDSVNFARTCLIAAAAAALSGCVSAGGGKDSLINSIPGSYQVPKSTALPNDIKQILAEGGLDVSDPSAPIGGTKVAEMATSNAPRPGEIEKLVARLENGSAAPKPVQTASAPEAAGPPLAELSLVSDKPASAAVAVAEADAPARQSVTFTYPDIGARADSDPVVAAAMTPKPRRRIASAPAHVRAAPVPQEAKKPRRF